jgi:uncharacterized protein (DUF427 family)
MPPSGPVPLDAQHLLEPSPRWVRVRVAGQFVADSKRVLLLREPGRLPVYYFPRSDVRTECLVPASHATPCAKTGAALSSSRRACRPATTCPSADVRLDLLVPTNTETRCPYKGLSSYYAVVVGSTVVRDIAWCYRHRIPECSKIENLSASSTSAWTRSTSTARSRRGRARDGRRRSPRSSRPRRDTARAPALIEGGDRRHPPRPVARPRLGNPGQRASQRREASGPMPSLITVHLKTPPGESLLNVTDQTKAALKDGDAPMATASCSCRTPRRGSSSTRAATPTAADIGADLRRLALEPVAMFRLRT